MTLFSCLNWWCSFQLREMTRRELEKVRDEDLALSELQEEIYNAKFIHKLRPVFKICERLHISEHTYYRHLRGIRKMLARLGIT